MIDSVGTSKTCVENSDFPREFSTNNNAVSCLRFVFIWSLFEAEGKTVKTNEVNSDNSRAKTYFYMENFIKSKWAILSMHLTSNGESLNYLKEPRTSEVTYFYLCDFVLGAYVILAFFDFWFITKWQFLKLSHNITCAIDQGNYKTDRESY